MFHDPSLLSVEALNTVLLRSRARTRSVKWRFAGQIDSTFHPRRSLGGDGHRRLSRMTILIQRTRKVFSPFLSFSISLLVALSLPPSLERVLITRLR